MEYIVHKPFDGLGLDGAFELPRGTLCEERDGVLIAPDGRRVCYVDSENGWTYFRVNTEEGLRRRTMLDRLFRHYESGRGDPSDFSPEKWPGACNFYWKSLLRTMSTQELTRFYEERYQTRRERRKWSGSSKRKQGRRWD